MVLAKGGRYEEPDVSPLVYTIAYLAPLHQSHRAIALCVTPYVEGESLRDQIHREKPGPVDEAVALASKVAGALQHGHGHGGIHRDIKIPSSPQTSRIVSEQAAIVRIVDGDFHHQTLVARESSLDGGGHLVAIRRP